jgi:hypothetical protein
MTDVNHGVVIPRKIEANISGYPSIEIRCTCPWSLCNWKGHHREDSGQRTLGSQTKCQVLQIEKTFCNILEEMKFSFLRRVLHRLQYHLNLILNVSILKPQKLSKVQEFGYSEASKNFGILYSQQYKLNEVTLKNSYLSKQKLMG